MREEKMKQSIIGIALALVLCGYYSNQQSAHSKQLRNSDQKIDILHPAIDNKVQQGTALQADIDLEEAKEFKFSFENSDVSFHSGVTRLDSIILVPHQTKLSKSRSE